MYVALSDLIVLRQKDGALIPCDEANADFREYQSWIADGNEPLPPPPTPVLVPQSVSPAQARVALLNAGLLAEVNEAIAQMPGVEGERARLKWEFASSVDRASSLVLGLGVKLGLNDDELDRLFISAASLE